MKDLAEVRKENPEYKYLSDKQMLDRIYSEHYSDTPRDEFNAKVNYGQASDKDPAGGDDDPTGEAGGIIDIAKGAGETAVEFGKSAVTGAAKTAADFARGEQIESEQRAMAFAPPEEINAGPVIPTGENLTRAFGLHNPEGFWGEAGQLGGSFAINPVSYFGPGSAVTKFLTAAGAIFGGAGGKQVGGAGGELAGLAGGGFAWPAIVKSMSPNFVNAAVAAASDILKSEGVKSLLASQRTGNVSIGYWESIYGEAAGAGGKLSRTMEQQGREFTRAVLRRAGIDADAATPQVIDKRFKDIGTSLDNLAAANPARLDATFAQELINAENEYNLEVSEVNRKGFIEKIVNDYLGLMTARGGSGIISGEQMQSFRTDLLERIRGAGGDAAYSQALGDMLDAFDGAISRSLPRQAQEQWALLRRQYKNLLKIANASTGAGKPSSAGIITPGRLRTALTNTKRDKMAYARGQGDFSQLSHAGNLAMTPLPNSGTSQREQARQFATAIGKAGGFLFGAGGGYAAGGGAGALGGGYVASQIAGAVAPALVGRGLMSRPVQGYLGGNLPGQAAARRAQQGMPSKSWTLQRAVVPALPQMLQEQPSEGEEQ